MHTRLHSTSGPCRFLLPCVIGFIWVWRTHRSSYGISRMNDVMKRSLQVVSQAEGSRITLEGKEYINFSSNNYLGLARHPQVVEAAKEVLNHWGVGATSSRLISGSSIIHHDLES